MLFVKKGLLIFIFGWIKSATSLIFIYENSLANNTLFSNSSIFLPKNKSYTLKESFSLVESLQREIVVSFLDEWIKPCEDNNLCFGTRLESLLGLQHLSEEERECVRLNPVFAHTLVGMVSSLYYKHVTFIVFDTHCSRKMMHLIVRKCECLRLQSTLYWFTRRESAVQLHALKYMETKLVVLLSPAEHFPLVLNRADHYAFRNTLWLIPNYSEGTVSVDIDHTISFNTPGSYKRKYSNLTNVMTTLDQAYIKIEAICKRDIRRYDSIASCIRLHIYSKFADTAFPADTTAEVSITEHVRIPAGNISHITTTKKFKPNHELLESTRVFEQRKLRVVTLFDMPFVEQRPYHNYTRCVVGVPCLQLKNHTKVLTCCAGFGIEMFQTIIEHFTFDVEYYVVNDSSYGIKKGVVWDGLIGEIVEGRADIALGALTITEDRLRDVQFTVPIMEQQTGILTKPDLGLDFLNWKFLSPLAGKLQLVLWAIIISYIIVNYVIENVVYIASVIKGEKLKVGKYYPLFESISYIAGITLKRDLGGVNPKLGAARTCAIVYAFAMTIVVTMYTAQLAVQMMNREEEDPFTGSQDKRMRNPTPAFKFGTVKSSSYERYYKNSEVYEHKRMAKFMEKYNVPTVKAGVEAVKNQSLQAFITDYWFLSWYASRECELRVMKDSRTGSIGLAVGKTSGLVTPLNEVIQHMQQNEDTIALEKRWFLSFCSEPTSRRFSISDFGGILMVLLMTIVFSFPLLLPEKFYHTKNTRQRLKKWYHMRVTKASQ